MSLVIPIFSREEQKPAWAECESRLGAAAPLEPILFSAVQQAVVLRQAILKKAFSGQLVAQDANDEPAAYLLERLRTERSANPPTLRGRFAWSKT